MYIVPKIYRKGTIYFDTGAGVYIDKRNLYSAYDYIEYFFQENKLSGFRCKIQR